ncbi:MAG: methyltransferase [Bacteroidia bacterium]|nr:methyltransferase [Bacteroidia bacterium]
MSLFRFKQFTIRHQNSAMKVGTDSVLLGCLATATNPSSILDIGTGTGLLALMMAQRFPQAHIDAVEFEPAAADEAYYNFSHNTIGLPIVLHPISIQDFKSAVLYDLIISNPPYFEWDQHTQITNAPRAAARHTEQLSFEELANNCKRLLAPDGIVWIVLPTTAAPSFTQYAKAHSLLLAQQINLIPKAGKPANRVCMGLKHAENVTETIQSSLVIYNEDLSYTDDYFNLTYPFLLWLKR